MEPSIRNTCVGDRVRIAFFGTGSVATSVLRLCRRRAWTEVVGAARSPRSAGRIDEDLPDEWAGVPVWEDPDAMLNERCPEVALVATRSSLDAVLPTIAKCVARGVHVICTSEELAWPDVAQPGAMATLDRLAKDAEVAVVATGINPGFAFDVLPMVLVGAAWDVSRIVVQRTLDASVFGREIHRSLGIGYTEDGFRRAVESGHVRGHIGFAESARIVASAMGLEIDRFDEQIEPVLADRVHELATYSIRPPETAGVVQLATASVAGWEWLRFELSLHVDPGAAGWETVDRIRVYGQNGLDLTIKPGMQAVMTTAALMVNTIPAALAAPPGFYPAAALLPRPPWLGASPPRRRA